MVDRSDVIEMGVAVAAVALMIGSLYLIGQSYATNGHLPLTGAEAVVGAIVGFILLLIVIGVAFAMLDTETNDA